MMTFASTRCLGSTVSLLCTIWGRALEALALLMFVKGKNTAFNPSINIIEFAETWTDKKWVWYGPDWKECPARKALCYYLQSAQFSAKFKIIRAEFHINQLGYN